MFLARSLITGSYKALWSYNFVAPQDEEMPELATNDEWRGIMRRAREEARPNYPKGMTQSELAGKVGTSQVMISKIESGEAESSKFVLRICRVLSIPAPAHFIDEKQKLWSQLGHVVRFHDEAQFETLLKLVESMAKKVEEADRSAETAPDEDRPERRK